mmetsp:Transcript_28664/g.60789  ORF Transcript_28664/g.60789 Transcript_28664/m.60789 type:complete len:331 (+) Transcript_28664:99-1091(+)
MAEPPAKARRLEAEKFPLLLPLHFKEEVRLFLKQDMPHYDVGAFVVGDRPAVAHLLAKTDGVLAGVPFFDAVFEELGCTVEWQAAEGALVGPGHGGCEGAGEAATSSAATASASFDATAAHFKGRQLVAVVKGPVHRLLQGERTALNILSRASGIAAETRKLVAEKERLGWHGQIAATRKVTPGFRLVEKYAVIVGGGVPHRMNLSDMVMLKDNHVWACGGSISEMVKRARTACGFSSKIEVECQKLEEALEAAEAGAEVVMLDNFPGAEAKVAARKLKERFPHGLTVEVSGGLTTETMGAYLCPDIDVVSFGRLTHGYGVVDFSLKVSS